MEAEELTSLLQPLRRAQDRAEGAAEDAAAAEGRAEQAETDRDEAAVRFAMAWREWAASSGSQRLLGSIDWSSRAVTALLEDVEALAGEGAGPEANRELARLDALAQQVAAPARARHAQQVAALKARNRQETARREQLLAEAEDLCRSGTCPPWCPTGWTALRTVRRRCGSCWNSVPRWTPGTSGYRGSAARLGAPLRPAHPGRRCRRG